MKKFITSMFALATLLTASAQMASNVQARVYAYNLQQEVDTESKDVTSYKITFQTNCAANEGEAFVLLMQDGEEVYRIPAEATDNTLKNWEAVVDVYTVQEIAGNVEAGDYNWSVEVSADPVESFQMISGNATSSNFAFFRSYGVAVDKFPESANFGRVYVVNQYGSTTAAALVNRSTSVGIYSFAADLEAENNGAVNSCSILGDLSGSANSGSSPKDMVVGPDGLIYAAVATKNENIGVYSINPNDFSYERILDGTVDTKTYFTNTSGGDIIVGLPFAVGVYGSDDDREVYVISGQTYYQQTPYYMCNLSRYKIGTSDKWDSKPSYNHHEYAFRNTANIRIYHEYNAIEPIKTGGYWISQYSLKPTSGSGPAYSSGVYACPSLMYCDNNNNTQFTIEHSIANGSETARNGALAVHEESGVVAFSDGTNARFIKYSVNEDNTIAVDNDSYTSYTLVNQGSYSNSFDFDYAGNLYSTTNSGTTSAKGEMMAVFSVPDAMMGENKRVTPAKSDLLVKLTAEDITTGIVEVGVDAGAAVEYYNLQGVKVENPSNGIFIKKQGNKTTKVVL